MKQLISIMLIFLTCSFCNNEGKIENKNRNEVGFSLNQINANTKNSLLVNHFDRQKRINLLISYNFKNGILHSVDTIHTSERIKNNVLDNKYLLINNKNIINIKSKSELSTSNPPLYFIKGDSIIFKLDKSDKELGLYNVEKNTYKEYQDPFLNTNGVIKYYYSNKVDYRLFVKNQKKHKSGTEAFTTLNEIEEEIQATKSSKKYEYLNANNFESKEIMLETRSGTLKKVVANAGIGTLLHEMANVRLDVPIIWIDNETFIYSYIHKNTAKIKSINIKNGNQRTICQIDEIKVSMRNAFFYKDFQNHIIYSCEKGDFKINTLDRTYSEYQYIDLGYDFQKQVNGRTVFYNNKVIGELPQYQRSFSSNNYLAVHDISNKYKAVDIRIWSTIQEKWIDIKKSNQMISMTIIGWLENP
ncbi:hypothetical protein [uncultured Psychroserpens sp.]|uniref:hypothetical protein n=1 Tax=uncultured Psychroserpens sp. TaxID=255436 RepID=UPI00261B9413|nr:hypothetical protein [uncultured Psychroserpens sp.]